MPEPSLFLEYCNKRFLSTLIHMEASEFVLALVKQLTWPAVVVISLLLLRKPLGDVLVLAKRVRVKNMMDVEFAQVVQDEITAVGKEVEEIFDQQPVDQRRSSTIASLPTDGVLEAWKELDQAARQLAERQGFVSDEQDQEPYKSVQRYLQQHELADVKVLKIFADLRNLRNRVAHALDYQLGQATASRYVALCEQLVNYFNERNGG